MWERETGGGKLDMRVREVHKDMAEGIESARRAVFHHSRPCDDFAQLVRALKTNLARKCQVFATVALTGERIKKHADTILRAITILRTLPRVEIHHFAWEALLRLLKDWGETEVATYLSRHHLVSIKAEDLQQF